MAYTDFSLEQVCKTFHLTLMSAGLFDALAPLPVPSWLRETLAKGMPLALGSEKAHSEFIVAPILLASRDLSQDRVALYSGQRLDSDPASGLTGECDFVLTLTPPLPIMQAPVVCIVEAQKNDVDIGLGQCAAQMVGAQHVNARESTGISRIFGCVTTGETWQFLKLEHEALLIDNQRYYINAVGILLAVFQAIIGSYAPAQAVAV